MKNYHVLLGLILFLLLSCAEDKEQIKEVDLSEVEWKFRQVGTEKWYPASVPGDVISDLVNHEVIPKLYYRFNEDSIQWIEKKDWEFQTFFEIGFDLPDYQNTKIVFQGLDTYADVYLNDSLIIKADNMFCAWEKEVSDILRQGTNKLYIYFHSPIKIQDKRHEQAGYLLYNVNEQAPEEEKKRNFTRKAPYQYGWDWAPRFVTSGIWRPVKLVCTRHTKLEDVHFRPVHVSKDSAVYSIESGIVNYGSPLEGTVTYKVNGEIMKQEQVQLSGQANQIKSTLIFKNPKLWWCNGYGEPYLYDVAVELSAGGRKMDVYTDRLGIRDVQLIQKPDSIGRSFYIQLNGVPIFAKGANYIPMHMLPPVVTDSMYARLIQDAVQANMNMLRVWGGGIYEEEIFYDLCDENGLMVWQDFMFSCDMVPAKPYMFESIRKEAEYNVKRLRNHPSIVLWCGNNENLKAWKTRWDGRYNDEIEEELYQGYHHIFHEILPEITQQYQPELPYWPSSPAAYPGDKIYDRKSGDMHDWTIWYHGKDFEAFGKNVPRFVSEYGVQAYPAMATIDSFTIEKDKKYKSPVMNKMQKRPLDWIEPGFNGYDLIKRYVEKYFHTPVDFKSHLYLSQIMQAKAYKMAIEGHRGSPRCMGTLYWQLNDCWPTASWSTVDYYGYWKASHYAVKKAYRKLLLVPSLSGNDIKLVINSDYVKELPVKIDLFAFPILEKGRTTLKAEKSVELDSLALKDLYFNNIHTTGNQTGYYIEAKDESGAILATNILLPERMKTYDLQEPEIKTDKQIQNGNILITLTTDRFAKRVKIAACTEGEWSDNYFDLVPGVSHQVVFQPEDRVNLKEIGFTITSYANYIGKN